MKEQIFKYPNKEDKAADLVRLWMTKDEGNEKSFYDWIISNSNNLFWDGLQLSFHESKIMWYSFGPYSKDEWKIGTMDLTIEL